MICLVLGLFAGLFQSGAGPGRDPLPPSPAAAGPGWSRLLPPLTPRPPPSPRSLQRGRRAHLRGHQTGRDPAAPGRGDRPAVREEGPAAGGAEAPAGERPGPGGPGAGGPSLGPGPCGPRSPRFPPASCLVRPAVVVRAADPRGSEGCWGLSASGGASPAVGSTPAPGLSS